MRAQAGAPQVFERDRRIARRRVDAVVKHQLIDGADVRPTSEQHGSERHSQAVRGQVLVRQLREVRVRRDGRGMGARDDLGQGVRADVGLSIPDEQEVVGLVPIQDRARALQEDAQDGHCPGRDGQHPACLAFLALAAQLVACQVDVLDCEMPNARPPAAGGERDTQEGEVPDLIGPAGAAFRRRWLRRPWSGPARWPPEG